MMGVYSILLVFGLHLADCIPQPRTHNFVQNRSFTRLSGEPVPNIVNLLYETEGAKEDDVPLKLEVEDLRDETQTNPLPIRQREPVPPKSNPKPRFKPLPYRINDKDQNRNYHVIDVILPDRQFIHSDIAGSFSFSDQSVKKPEPITDNYRVLVEEDVSEDMQMTVDATNDIRTEVPTTENALVLQSEAVESATSDLKISKNVIESTPPSTEIYDDVSHAIPIEPVIHNDNKPISVERNAARDEYAPTPSRGNNVPQQKSIVHQNESVDVDHEVEPILQNIPPVLHANNQPIEQLEPLQSHIDLYPETTLTQDHSGDLSSPSALDLEVEYYERKLSELSEPQEESITIETEPIDTEPHVVENVGLTDSLESSPGYLPSLNLNSRTLLASAPNVDDVNEIESVNKASHENYGVRDDERQITGQIEPIIVPPKDAILYKEQLLYQQELANERAQKTIRNQAQQSIDAENLFQNHGLNIQPIPTVQQLSHFAEIGREEVKNASVEEERNIQPSVEQLESEPQSSQSLEKADEEAVNSLFRIQIPKFANTDFHNENTAPETTESLGESSHQIASETLHHIENITNNTQKLSENKEDEAVVNSLFKLETPRFTNDLQPDQNQQPTLNLQVDPPRFNGPRNPNPRVEIPRSTNSRVQIPQSPNPRFQGPQNPNSRSQIPQSPNPRFQVNSPLDNGINRNPNLVNSINSIDDSNRIGSNLSPFNEENGGSPPNSLNGHRYVGTSGNRRECVFSSMNRHMECYWGREPTEWCQTDRATRWTSEGCHCDPQVGACIIERSNSGQNQYTFCAPAANYDCPIPNDLFWTDEFGNKWLKKRKRARS